MSNILFLFVCNCSFGLRSIICMATAASGKVKYVYKLSIGAVIEGSLRPCVIRISISSFDLLQVLVIWLTPFCKHYFKRLMLYTFFFMEFV